jgi:hypothetical protein
VLPVFGKEVFMGKKTSITDDHKIYTSLPHQLLELKNKSVVLAGDTLLDPLYLAYVFAVAASVKTKIMVNKIDLIYLQVINGGDMPMDNGGEVSIDVDIKYQGKTVAANDAKLRPMLNLDAPLLSQSGSLALVYEMLDRGVIDLYEFHNQYFDGLCFLQTGDPDIADMSPKAYDVVYGWKSVIADVLRGEDEHDYWHKKLTSLGFSFDRLISDFLATQIWTRVGCIGRSARTKEPFLTYNPWTISWLNKSGLGREAGPPLEQRYSVIKDAFAKKPRDLSIGEVIDFIDNRVTQTTILEALERDYALRKRRESETREDWLLFVLNLILGLVPGLGQLTTIVTYLYQKQRGKNN